VPHIFPRSRTSHKKSLRHRGRGCTLDKIGGGTDRDCVFCNFETCLSDPRPVCSATRTIYTSNDYWGPTIEDSTCSGVRRGLA